MGTKRDEWTIAGEFVEDGSVTKRIWRPAKLIVQRDHPAERARLEYGRGAFHSPRRATHRNNPLTAQSQNRKQPPNTKVQTIGLTIR